MIPNVVQSNRNFYHFNSLNNYFPSVSVEQYQWVRNTFEGINYSLGQFTFKEEELAEIATERILQLKH